MAGPRSPASAPLRAVLFDAAGTLIRPCEPPPVTYARIARHAGVELRPERVARGFARALRRAPPMAFPEAPRERIPGLERSWWRDRVRESLAAAGAPASFAGFEDCFERLFTHYARTDAWEALPGADEALAALRAAGLRAGVASNFDVRLHGVLEGLGLRARLDAVVLPADAGAAKPSPRLFAEALARLGVPASAALYVGDDPQLDVAAARAAGLRALDVRELASLADLPARLAADGLLGFSPFPHPDGRRA